MYKHLQGPPPNVRISISAGARRRVPIMFSIAESPNGAVSVRYFRGTITMDIIDSDKSRTPSPINPPTRKDLLYSKHFDCD